MKSFRSPRRPKKNKLAIGSQAVINALQEGKQLDKIYVDQRLTNAATYEVKKLAVQYGVPLSYVPAAKLNTFNAGAHDGVIGQFSLVQYQSLQDVISWIVENGQSPLLLILDGVTDIRNIGAIARTAWCCGVHAIIIPEKGVGALNEDAILTSAGALEQIPVCRVGSIMKAIDELHLNGIKVFASEMTASTHIAGADFTVPAAIVMGGEEKGVYPAVLKICDENISIPMQNDFESLNVSVATGMILYEAMKQRMSVV
ncbi:MAG: 23S rRNA (guanosine(2251)-2'-O)-methyltransferase RlmB [Niabella sp.]